MKNDIDYHRVSQLVNDLLSMDFNSKFQGAREIGKPVASLSPEELEKAHQNAKTLKANPLFHSLACHAAVNECNDDSSPLMAAYRESQGAMEKVRKMAYQAKALTTLVDMCLTLGKDYTTVPVGTRQTAMAFLRALDEDLESLKVSLKDSLLRTLRTTPGQFEMLANFHKETFPEVVDSLRGIAASLKFGMTK
jgi:hypothetical protein